MLKPVQSLKSFNLVQNLEHVCQSQWETIFRYKSILIVLFEDLFFTFLDVLYVVESQRRDNDVEKLKMSTLSIIKYSFKVFTDSS